jgi:hypothetical protein
MARSLIPCSRSKATSYAPMRSGASVNFSRKPSVARSFSLMGAVRQSFRISRVNSSPRIDDATAPCASSQNAQALSFDVKAPNSSRSPMVQSDGPRRITCARSQNGLPKYSGRYINTLITSTGSVPVKRRVKPSKSFCGLRCPLFRMDSRTRHLQHVGALLL